MSIAVALCAAILIQPIHAVEKSKMALGTAIAAGTCAIGYYVFRTKQRHNWQVNKWQRDHPKLDIDTYLLSVDQELEKTQQELEEAKGSNKKRTEEIEEFKARRRRPINQKMIQRREQIIEKNKNIIKTKTDKIKKLLEETREAEKLLSFPYFILTAVFDNMRIAFSWACRKQEQKSPTPMQHEEETTRAQAEKMVKLMSLQKKERECCQLLKDAKTNKKKLEDRLTKHEKWFQKHILSLSAQERTNAITESNKLHSRIGDNNKIIAQVTKLQYELSQALGTKS